ncbi:curli production assembly/transport protein CsgE [Microbulbifer thermotolerans]|uniref:Curli production assembly/transport component CsgE n=1 Tax=Microbulbifer thermotolerans TaxID=252514 RepID=A0AB35I1M2_MICTH|nr:CsgE family curli-type amyloid fiber assembly protein [Microbulbifer thermotolerans]MCX2781226.1 curli production assembly/transport protein CsgE [Microbulbifer thermotolerans]MCX2783418.1 curli production assembly/transport protein CsgE [Microbulbifer thermotolerans]MCX2793453.1 curli production assembly/transport protein CsgE [Microbulbifer thermotolerans]MCX2802896.1 curli production assembly/transport protein CsgE [Microbulbifer thermotolerans]MCX2803745.1 curli production assembly/tran
MRALILLLPLLSASVSAQETDVNGGTLEENDGRIEDEISGFNIDRTITRTGHDFVRYMSEYRNLHYPDSTYNLTIHERPSARWGNLIWITYNNKTVFRRFISPSTNDIRRLAEEASIHIHEMVLQEKVRSALTDHFDLGKDEF